MDYLKKIKKRIIRFGIKVEIVILLSKVFSRKIFPSKVQLYFSEKKHKEIKKWLVNHYIDIIEKYKKEKLNAKEAIKSNIIWIFWWQGIQNAPEIVKKCMESIKTQVTEKQIIFISKENYSEFIKIPEEILRKVEEGIFTKTFFSDMIRMNLLSKYGGFWMDATIFMTQDIFQEISQEDFYTLKLEKDNFHNQKMVSKGNWCGFFIGGKSNKLFNFVYEFLKEYMIQEDFLIEYFLIDYVISIAYETFEDVKTMIDCVPSNNEKIFELYQHINEGYESQIYQEIMKKNKIHKLSCKDKVNEYNEEGKITFYGKVVSLKENEEREK